MLIDSVVTHLRAGLAGLTGDDGTPADCTVFADYSAPLCSVPYLVVMEVGEDYQFLSPGVYGLKNIPVGQLQIDVYHSDRASCQFLVDTVAALLTDPTITPTDGRLMMMRPAHWRAVPLPQTGPESPAIFKRSLMINYQQQRSP